MFVMSKRAFFQMLPTSAFGKFHFCLKYFLAITFERIVRFEFWKHQSFLNKKCYILVLSKLKIDFRNENGTRILEILP